LGLAMDPSLANYRKVFVLRSEDGGLVEVTDPA
jgi:hypothetical protein